MSFLGFAFPLSIPIIFNAYSLFSRSFNNSLSYFVAQLNVSLYTFSASNLDIIVLDISSNLTISKSAPLTPILLNCNSNSFKSAKGLAFLQLSKFEFAIFNKYSQTASGGIPCSW